MGNGTSKARRDRKADSKRRCSHFPQVRRPGFQLVEDATDLLSPRQEVHSATRSNNVAIIGAGLAVK